MKPEALDAFATHSIRPGALEAATSDQKITNKSEIPNMDEHKINVSLRVPPSTDKGSNRWSLFHQRPSASDQP